jgi:hypothetical protein
MDPFQQFLSPFRGSGRVEDYFVEAPDLSYLASEGVGYDPSLDAPALVAQGVPPAVAQQVQGVRARILQSASQRKAMEDERGALKELSSIDPSRESFAKDLLGILQKYPNAHRSPNFTSQLKMVGDFARLMPQKAEDKLFDPDTIKDPDLYQVAITEKWDTLPEKQGMRRLYDAQARKEKRLKLITDGGLSPEEVDELEKSTGLSEERIVHALSQAKALKPEKNLTHEQSRFLAQTQSKANKARQIALSDEAKLEYLRAKYSPDDATRTEFSKEQWDEAYEAGNAPNLHDKELEDYRRSLGLTPSQLAGSADAPSQSTEAEAPTITSQEQYNALPVGTPYLTPDGRKAIKKK